MSTMINPLWTAYNNLYNEGGEGYNPHDQYACDDADGEPLWSRLDGEKYRLLRVMQGTSTADPRYAELERELQTVEAALKIARDANV